MIRSLFDFIFPPLCLNCRSAVGSHETVCESCFKTIDTQKTLFCGRCRARLPENKKICHSDFPYLLGAACSYENPAIRNLIRGLKFKFFKDASLPLAFLLIAYVEQLKILKGDWLIIPIPLGKRRLRQRSFNQSELIARIFADHFGLPLETDALIRAKETRPQSELKNPDERANNIKGCFAVADPQKISGRNIILIDDVVTSGATFLEAATFLKIAGAQKIIALAVAKS